MSTSTVSMAPLSLPAKRKRAQISYAELDDELFDSAYESGEDVAMDEIEDDLLEGDTIYGSRKKPAKKLKSRKKARLTRPRSSKPFEPFPFLSLPAELRDYIYELALTDDDGISLVSQTKSFRRTIARSRVALYNDEGYYSRGSNRIWRSDVEDEDAAYNSLTPNLLAVNKQIHSEGVGYLYKQRIILEDTMALHTFLAAIGPTNRLQLSDVTVRNWGYGRGTHKAMNVAALTMLAGCTNLKTFHLDCKIGYLRTPRDLARQLYRDGHYFLEAYGSANGKRDAAVEVLQLSDWNFDRSNYSGWRRPTHTLPEETEFKEKFRAELRRLLNV